MLLLCGRLGLGEFWYPLIRRGVFTLCCHELSSSDWHRCLLCESAHTPRHILAWRWHWAWVFCSWRRLELILVLSVKVFFFLIKHIVDPQLVFVVAVEYHVFKTDLGSLLLLFLFKYLLAHLKFVKHAFKLAESFISTVALLLKIARILRILKGLYRHA